MNRSIVFVNDVDPINCLQMETACQDVLYSTQTEQSVFQEYKLYLKKNMNCNISNYYTVTQFIQF